MEREALSDKVILHEDLGTNASYTWPLLIESTPGCVEEAFKNAAYTVKERYVQQRLIPMAMEPRAIAAVPQPFGGDVTMYSATQIPHILKVMAALTLGIPEHQLRIIAPSVGGGFGSKLDVYAEELLCLALSRKHNVPVRWVEERSENAHATIHGRGQIQHVELAADKDGKLTAVRFRIIADMGAYLQLVTPGVPLLGAFLYAGVYNLPQAYDFSCTGVFTSLTPTDAYRGAGRPEATYAIECGMDALARKMNIDPYELRKRNFIQKEQFPYTAFSGLTYDSGDHALAAEKATQMADYAGIRKQQVTQNVPGAAKRIGIGMASYFEMCGLAPSRVLASLNYGAGGWEAATVRVLPTAKVQVVTGTSPHGQGHETSWAMIASEKLGIPIEGLCDGFSWKSQDLEHSAQLARQGWLKAKASILSGEYFLVVLDEMTYPLIYGWLDLNDVCETLKQRPQSVHVCITGRRCPAEIIELADTVSEITMVKHAFQAGIPAQRGIED